MKWTRKPEKDRGVYLRTLYMITVAFRLVGKEVVNGIGTNSHHLDKTWDEINYRQIKTLCED